MQPADALGDEVGERNTKELIADTKTTNEHRRTSKPSRKEQPEVEGHEHEEMGTGAACPGPAARGTAAGGGGGPRKKAASETASAAAEAPSAADMHKGGQRGTL